MKQLRAVAAVVLLGALAPRLSSQPEGPAQQEPKPETPFTLVAIGDTGKLNQQLYDNAVGVTREVEKGAPGQRALVFLGDNFYEYGLSRDPIQIREKRYRAIYEDLFGAAMRVLVRDGCPKDTATSSGSDCAAGAVNFVHAVAGNHDYYSGALSLAGVNVLPTGFSTEGNEYCRARGLLTPEERQAIENDASPQAPPSQATPAKPVQTSRPWRWRYHFDLPHHEYWPIDPARPDGPEIHVVFFDSAAIVRAAENCGRRKLQCPGAPVDEDDPENPLSCVRAQAALCRLQEHLDSEKDRPAVRWRVFVAHHPFWTVGAHGGYIWSAVEGEAVWTDQCSKAVDPQGWFKNMQFDPEDECSPGWAWYIDQLRTILKDRAPFDLALMGHDHSLQLIQPGDKDALALARLQIVSGAGAKRSVVRGPGPRLNKSPRLERVYTASTEKEGESRSGFAAVRFYADRMQIQFFDGWKTIPAAHMAAAAEAREWEGKDCFLVGGSGAIDPSAECRW